MFANARCVLRYCMWSRVKKNTAGLVAGNGFFFLLMFQCLIPSSELGIKILTNSQWISPQNKHQQRQKTYN